MSMNRLVDAIARAEDVLSKGFLAGCSLLVFVAAITRAFGAPVIWAIDVAMLLFIWCAFFGADKALRNRQHIIIDIAVRYLPQRLQRLLLIAHWAIIVVFLGALVVLGTQLTLLNVQRPMGDTEISYAWVTSAVPVGALLMLITAATQLVAFVRDPDVAFGGGDSPL
jgi:TRAP-type C4-dicarboxylate transport system permease small subunit